MEGYSQRYRPSSSGRGGPVRSSGGRGGFGSSGGRGGGFGSSLGVSRGGGLLSRRMERKSHVREEQVRKEQRKNEEEASWFYQLARRNAGRRPPFGDSERELFSNTGGGGGINFAKYDAITVKRSGAQCEKNLALEDFNEIFSVVPTFLKDNLIRMQYRVPTPIQKHAIPNILDGFDVLCAAQTGSGKTMAFLTPMIANMENNGKQPSSAHHSIETPARPRILVLAPTRELALQIHLEAQKLCFKHSVRAVACYGGIKASQKGGQLEQLSYGVDILIATPGRLIDFLEHELVFLGDCTMLVLDEADRMLDMGFKPQIERIMRLGLPAIEKRQTALFSATFPEEIRKLAATYMKPYIMISVGKVGSSTDNITQTVMRVDHPKKKEKLLEVLRGQQDVAQATIIFCQKKSTCEYVCRYLNRELRPERLYGVEIHGDRTQSQREEALAKFRQGRANILVATDVAARGLDIDNVAHVVNFDLPPSAEEMDSYVHRIGRTGRAGKTGQATSFFVDTNDKKTGNAGLRNSLVKILRDTNQTIPDFLMDERERARMRAQQSRDDNEKISADEDNGKCTSGGKDSSILSSVSDNSRSLFIASSQAQQNQSTISETIFKMSSSSTNKKTSNRKDKGNAAAQIKQPTGSDFFNPSTGMLTVKMEDSDESSSEYTDDSGDDEIGEKVSSGRGRGGRSSGGTRGRGRGRGGGRGMRGMGRGRGGVRGRGPPSNRRRPN